MAKQITKKTDDKNAKFRELANKRVSKAISAIRTVGKLAGRRGSYSDDEVAQIVAALNGAVEKMGERFETGAPESSEFELG